MTEALFQSHDAAGDRSRARWVRRAGQRQMSLTRKQPRRGIEADPACYWKVNFGLRVEVREVDFRADRSV